VRALRKDKSGRGNEMEGAQRLQTGGEHQLQIWYLAAKTSIVCYVIKRLSQQPPWNAQLCLCPRRDRQPQPHSFFPTPIHRARSTRLSSPFTHHFACPLNPPYSAQCPGLPYPRAALHRAEASSGVGTLFPLCALVFYHLTLQPAPPFSRSETNANRVFLDLAVLCTILVNLWWRPATPVDAS
jgi:hypothetical protein